LALIAIAFAALTLFISVPTQMPKERAPTVLEWLQGTLVRPLKHFLHGLRHDEVTILMGLLAVAALTGFVLGKWRASPRGKARHFGAIRFPRFQNSGEQLVSRMLQSNFGAPDYHLMNHVTLRMADGTTQVDHILVSRFGVIVIETKDYSGWIYGAATDQRWTQVHFRQKFPFQNPIHQNFRHVRAVQDLLDFLPPDAVTSVVVFAGSAEFKTEIPPGVVLLGNLVASIRSHTVERVSRNRMQFCVGRLETARLAISGETDVEHVESVRRRLRSTRSSFPNRDD
jgi:hypothetical protein